MKIIGITGNNFLVEMSRGELKQITANDDSSSWAAADPKMIGSTMSVDSVWYHLRKIQETDTERAKIAESLRAAATLIENTPLTLVYPPQPTVDTQDRIEA